MPLSLDDILQSADEHRASDVFLMEGEVPRIKINEQIMLLGDDMMQRNQMTSFWHACGVNPDLESDRDSGLVSPKRTRYRVNMHKALGRLGMIMRRLRTELPTLSHLGVPDQLLAQWVMRPHGLILITGPTGTGKSTTLAALLQWINENMARHIVTIEDPVEFIYTNKTSMFTQREVGRDTSSYARGIRGAMRQAPDVIMVAEIKDPETTLAVLQACEAGHLVLATLPGDHVTDALLRMTHLFPAGQTKLGLHMLSQQLIGVLCQKFAARRDGGQHLLVEHFENGEMAKLWISNQEMEQLHDCIQSGQAPNSVTFFSNIIRAYEAGIIDESQAIAANRTATEAKRFSNSVN